MFDRLDLFREDTPTPRPAREDAPRADQARPGAPGQDRPAREDRARDEPRAGHRREHDARERPRRSIAERKRDALADVGLYRAVSYTDLSERHFDAHPYATRRAINHMIRGGLIEEHEATGGPGADVQPDSTLPPAQVPAVRAPTGSADGGPSPGGGAQNAVDSEHVPRKSGAALALVADSGCVSPAQGRDTRDDTQWCAPSRTGGVLWCGDDVAVRYPRRRMAASRGEPTSKTRHPTQEGSPVVCRCRRVCRGSLEEPDGCRASNSYMTPTRIRYGMGSAVLANALDTRK